MFKPQSNPGYIIISIGGLLALVAFLLLPYVTTATSTSTGLLLVTTTALQRAIDGESGLIVAGLVALFMLLGIGLRIVRKATAKPEGIVTALVFILAGTLMLVLLSHFYVSPTVVSHSVTRGATSATTSFTCSSGIANGGFNSTTTDSCTEVALTPYYGPGFWLYMLGMVLVISGDLLQLGRLLDRRSAAQSA